MDRVGRTTPPAPTEGWFSLLAQFPPARLSALIPPAPEPRRGGKSNKSIFARSGIIPSKCHPCSFITYMRFLLELTVRPEGSKILVEIGSILGLPFKRDARVEAILRRFQEG